MGRLVQTTLKAPLANEILFGKLIHGGIAHVDVKDGAIDISCDSAPAPELEDEDEAPPSKPPPPPPPRKAREPVN
jgi:ATP-dependent Clp protease ATP-binding subunit ClpA